MPELPEVETVARRLRETTRGLAIRAVEVFDPKLDHLLGEQSPLHAGIRDIVRRGKFLALLLDDDRVLLMHMMMSGRILVRRVDDLPDRYLRAAFTLDCHTQIRFCDPRRFGTARVIGPDEYKGFQSRLGIEPFSRRFTTHNLACRLEGRTVAIKTALLNQSILAGVGNIYADEALWRARLSPLLPAGELDRRQVASLVRAVRRVLRDGLKAGGTTFGRYADADGRPGANQQNLNVFRRTGRPCLRCRTAIESEVIGGRTSHFCPRCQRR